MSLVISKVFTYDTDAGNYIQAVEAADGQALEAGTRQAINNFVIGCKQDGIWSAIKASCILAGARTLSGALVPLAGTAPTNNNFVSGDYDRKIGLIGDASTKYLDSNRNCNTDPQNSQHLAIFAKTTSFNSFSIRGWIGSVSSPLNLLDHERAAGTTLRAFSRSGTDAAGSTLVGVGGFAGVSRATSAECIVRGAGVSTASAITSSTPNSDDIFVFARSSNGVPQSHSSIRLAFYSIGESLDLALLDARVTALITAFGVAIP